MFTELTPKFDRFTTISELENMAGNGMFEGEPEENMDFSLLPDDELEWYWYEWILSNLDLDNFARWTDTRN